MPTEQQKRKQNQNTRITCCKRLLGDGYAIPAAWHMAASKKLNWKEHRSNGTITEDKQYYSKLKPKNVK